MTDAASGVSLLESVQRIAAVIKKNAASAERDRSLSKETVRAMLDAGLFRMWLPRSFGGLETDPVTAVRVFEEVSRLDSAAGWNLQIASSVIPLFAWFPDEGAQEIFGGNQDVILGGTIFPPARAVPCDGGYRVSGRFPFASGCHHCAWFLGSALIFDGDEPRRGEDGNPLQLMVAYSARQTQILDTWHTMGMRGTGSHDVVVQDIFIPNRRTALLAPLKNPGKAFQGPLYRLRAWGPLAALAPPALGIARAAIDDFVDLAGKKTPSFLQTTLRDQQLVQTQVAHAEALLGAARAYFHEALRDGWNAASQGEQLSLPHKIKLQLATSYAVRAAADAVDLIHQAAGTTAIRQEHPFEQHFRDVHVITQHSLSSTNRYANVGRVLLGLEVDWPFFNL